MQENVGLTESKSSSNSEFRRFTRRNWRNILPKNFAYCTFGCGRKGCNLILRQKWEWDLLVYHWHYETMYSFSRSPITTHHFVPSLSHKCCVNVRIFLLRQFLYRGKYALHFCSSSALQFVLWAFNGLFYVIFL